MATDSRTNFLNPALMGMPRTRLYSEGAIAARLLLALLHDTAAAMTDGGLTGATCADVMLICAVFIGQSERRPMTAGKIASYIGMPRPTAIRRLQEMLANGLLEMDAKRRWLLRIDTPEKKELLGRAIVANAQHIQSAAAAMSRLDTFNVASQQSAALRQPHGDAK